MLIALNMNDLAIISNIKHFFTDTNNLILIFILSLHVHSCNISFLKSTPYACCESINQLSESIYQLFTTLDLITNFDLITRFKEVSIEHLQWARLANRGRLLLRTPGPVPFGTCFCFNVETILSWTCCVSGIWILNIPLYLYFAKWLWNNLFTILASKSFSKNQYQTGLE